MLYNVIKTTSSKHHHYNYNENANTTAMTLITTTKVLETQIKNIIQIFLILLECYYNIIIIRV